jgi:hypothetical protein
MSDAEYWNDVKPFLKKRSQEKRASNRESGARILTEAGIPYESKNGGAHLVVGERYDYWPGTGLWIHRETRHKGRGIRGLIAHFIGTV